MKANSRHLKLWHRNILSNSTSLFNKAQNPNKMIFLHYLKKNLLMYVFFQMIWGNPLYHSNVFINLS